MTLALDAPFVPPSLDLAQRLALSGLTSLDVVAISTGIGAARLRSAISGQSALTRAELSELDTLCASYEAAIRLANAVNLRCRLMRL